MNYLIALILSVTVGLIFSAVIYVSFNNLNKHIIVPEKTVSQEVLNKNDIPKKDQIEKKL